MRSVVVARSPHRPGNLDDPTTFPSHSSVRSHIGKTSAKFTKSITMKRTIWQIQRAGLDAADVPLDHTVLECAVRTVRRRFPESLPSFESYYSGNVNGEDYVTMIALEHGLYSSFITERACSVRLRIATMLCLHYFDMGFGSRVARACCLLHRVGTLMSMGLTLRSRSATANELGLTCDDLALCWDEVLSVFVELREPWATAFPDHPKRFATAGGDSERVYGTGLWNQPLEAVDVVSPVALGHTPEEWRSRVAYMRDICREEMVKDGIAAMSGPPADREAIREYPQKSTGLPAISVSIIDKMEDLSAFMMRFMPGAPSPNI